MFIYTKLGRNTVTIAIVVASILGSTSVLAGRATGLPHYANSAPTILPVPDVAPSSSKLSGAERIVKLETDVQVLRVCLKNMAALRTSLCAL